MTILHVKKSIGRSSSRLAFLLIALVFACLGIRQSAQAGYIVTLRQVGPNVVATGSGPIDLTGLSIVGHGIITETDIEPANGGIFTGQSGPSDIYQGTLTGPTNFGSGSATFTNSGSGDMVAIYKISNFLVVPTGYVSGNALSDMATYSFKTFANLGVRPGTYVWTWGTGANQNFTLQIVPPPPPGTGPPVAITNPATLIASFSAKLNGSVNPHGLTPACIFNMEQRTATDSLPPRKVTLGTPP